MCESMDEKETPAEIRGGDKPTDYIKPIPPARPLRADALDDSDAHDDDES